MDGAETLIFMKVKTSSAESESEMEGEQRKFWNGDQDRRHIETEDVLPLCSMFFHHKMSFSSKNGWFFAKLPVVIFDVGNAKV